MLACPIPERADQISGQVEVNTSGDNFLPINWPLFQNTFKLPDKFLRESTHPKHNCFSLPATITQFLQIFWFPDLHLVITCFYCLAAKSNTSRWNEDSRMRIEDHGLRIEDRRMKKLSLTFHPAIRHSSDLSVVSVVNDNCYFAGLWLVWRGRAQVHNWFWFCHNFFVPFVWLLSSWTLCGIETI